MHGVLLSTQCLVLCALCSVGFSPSVLKSNSQVLLYSVLNPRNQGTHWQLETHLGRRGRRLWHNDLFDDDHLGRGRRGRGHLVDDNDLLRRRRGRILWRLLYDNHLWTWTQPAYHSNFGSALLDMLQDACLLTLTLLSEGLPESLIAQDKVQLQPCIMLSWHVQENPQ